MSTLASGGDGSLTLLHWEIEITSVRELPRPPQRFDPRRQQFAASRLQVEKLDAHSYARLHDAHHHKRLQCLRLAMQLHSSACADGQRLVRADEAPAHGNVGGNSIHLFPALEIDQFDIGGKWKSDGIAPVAYTIHPGT